MRKKGGCELGLPFCTREVVGPGLPRRKQARNKSKLDTKQLKKTTLVGEGGYLVMAFQCNWRAELAVLLTAVVVAPLLAPFHGHR